MGASMKEYFKKEDFTLIEQLTHFDLYGYYRHGKLLFRECFPKPLEKNPHKASPQFRKQKYEGFHHANW